LASELAFARPKAKKISTDAEFCPSFAQENSHSLEQ